LKRTRIDEFRASFIGSPLNLKHFSHLLVLNGWSHPSSSRSPEMSNLWRYVHDTQWEPVPLDSTHLPASVRVVRVGQNTDNVVTLLAPPRAAVHVNGLPVIGGLRVLEHRDEILVEESRFYFSAESRPFVTPFQLDNGSRRPTCPVCRGPLRDGETAVRCPGCSRWFHQLEVKDGQRGRTCWTYAATCRFCQHPTSLSGEPTWTPMLEEEPAHAT
jgi:hypothetical protein